MSFDHRKYRPFTPLHKPDRDVLWWGAPICLPPEIEVFGSIRLFRAAAHTEASGSGLPVIL